MKKSLLTSSVCIAVLCCTLAYASTGQGSSTLFGIIGASNDSSQPVAEVTNPARSAGILKDMKISGESLLLAKSHVPSAPARRLAAQSDSVSQGNVEEHVFDLWRSAYDIVCSDGVYYDRATDSISFNGASTNHIFIGATSTNNYAWRGQAGLTYHFKGELKSDGAATVSPCVCYVNESTSQYMIVAIDNIVLDESNSFMASFDVPTSGIPADAYMVVAYIVEGSSTETTITSVRHELSYTIRSIASQEWTPENDLPGLGLSEWGSGYTVLCEDGVTTLGICDTGDKYVVAGINTTASEVVFPPYITIGDGIVYNYQIGGVNGGIDWSAAPNLTTVDLTLLNQAVVATNFDGSAVTDLYVGSNCQFGAYGFNNTYLHIPYGVSRDNYTPYGFKRVLVGDEQPEYPEPSHSDWVIAGENDGDYFGISLLNGRYCISEVFTSNDSVVLPEATPTANGLYYINGFGSDYNYGSGTTCLNAPALKSVTVLPNYSIINVSWSDNPITDLHMQGDVPEMGWSLPAGMNVYVGEQAYYSNYENNSNWNRANIQPDGWEFEWMTVNVGRKGEFAQTYIEMTDADWTLGMYVKVTGTLNETDLRNIKNLTNLRKLDLSEAVFTSLPESFMYQMTSLAEVTLPESLTYVPDNAFSNCSKLTKVTAPGLTTVGNSAFAYCSKLTEIDLSKVVYIANDAFQHCTDFNPAEFSKDLWYIGQSAFYATGITQVSLPEGMTAISHSAFYNCPRLTKVTLPGTVTSIMAYAFYRCYNLAEINIPENVSSIGHYAFQGCTSLTEISLPSNLQQINSGALADCSSLTTVKCKAIVPPVADGDFTYGIDLNHCTLYVAPFAIDAYRAAANWSNFYIMKPLNEPVKNIYINRPMTFDLLSEDNAVLQENPNMVLDYSYVNYNNTVGQLSASGDGTLSAGVFKILHSFQSRNNSGDYRPTLINNAENMRADSVLCSINFQKNRWHFISFQYDVRMEDIFAQNNTDFVIRQYNSANRASGDDTVSNWENVPADGVLKAGKGYIIQAANNATNESGNTYAAIVRFPSRNTVTKNNLFTSNNVIVPLEEYPAEFAHNRSWNLVGNPYPCYYDMHYLMDDFTTPIVLWRGTNYQAYSPVDDDIILRPNEAFFVQRPLDAEQMVFGVEGRMHYTQAINANVTPGVNGAPAFERDRSDRVVFNFNIEGCGTDDRARIVMNENALPDYEINRDASKFFAETPVGAEIFVDGDVRYDICERPFDDGKAVLGTRIGTKGQYTISLSGRNISGWVVTLTDTETGVSVKLNETSYSFDTEAGTAAGRFILTFTAPDIESVEGVCINPDNADVRIVNASGITVFTGDVNEFKATAPAGVYVVVDSEKAYKIVVK